MRITPPGFATWLAAGKSAGVIAPDTAENVTIALDPSSLSPGVYTAAVRISTNDPERKTLTVPVQVAVTGPEVEVLGNGLPIVSGQENVSVEDRTDFGHVAVGAGATAHIFLIRNPGTSPLVLDSVVVSGSGFSLQSAPASSIPPRGLTMCSVVFSPSDAGESPGAISFTSNDADEPEFHFALLGRGLRPIEAWRLANFGALPDGGLGADDVDLDHDGLVNLLEYAFTLDPRKADAGGQPDVMRGDDGFLRISFSRNTLRTDLTYLVEGSSDFATWTSLASSVGGAPVAATAGRFVAESGSGEIQFVTVGDSVAISPNTRRFLRVRVSRD